MGYIENIAWDMERDSVIGNGDLLRRGFECVKAFE